MPNPQAPNPYDAPPRTASCCANLRCKSMYYLANERPGLLHDEPEMGYWCLVTSTDLGPDGKAATHKACQGGRGCFEGGPAGG